MQTVEPLTGKKYRVDSGLGGAFTLQFIERVKSSDHSTWLYHFKIVDCGEDWNGKILKYRDSDFHKLTEKD